MNISECAGMVMTYGSFNEATGKYSVTFEYKSGKKEFRSVHYIDAAKLFPHMDILANPSVLVGEIVVVEDPTMH